MLEIAYVVGAFLEFLRLCQLRGLNIIYFVTNRFAFACPFSYHGDKHGQILAKSF